MGVLVISLLISLFLIKIIMSIKIQKSENMETTAKNIESKVTEVTYRKHEPRKLQFGLSKYQVEALAHYCKTGIAEIDENFYYFMSLAPDAEVRVETAKQGETLISDTFSFIDKKGIERSITFNYEGTESELTKKCLEVFWKRVNEKDHNAAAKIEAFSSNKPYIRTYKKDGEIVEVAETFQTVDDLIKSIQMQAFKSFNWSMEKIFTFNPMKEYGKSKENHIKETVVDFSKLQATFNIGDTVDLSAVEVVEEAPVAEIEEEVVEVAKPAAKKTAKKTTAKKATKK
jgi:hypothetical protein